MPFKAGDPALAGLSKAEKRKLSKKRKLEAKKHQAPQGQALEKPTSGGEESKEAKAQSQKEKPQGGGAAKKAKKAAKVKMTKEERRAKFLRPKKGESSAGSRVGARTGPP